MFRKALRARICAAPILMDGEDLRSLPLSMRKANLERLLRGRPDGIFVNPFEIGEIGPDLFRAACGMGLEGLVSKRSDSRPSGWRGKLPGRRRRKASSAVSQAGMDVVFLRRSAALLGQPVPRQDSGAK